MEILDGNSFSNYRMGKTLFMQNSFENTCVDMEYRDVGVEVEKWGMMVFDKKHIVSLYLRRPANNLCDHIYPHMGKGVVI